MSDNPTNAKGYVERELEKANARLPVVLPDTPMPLEVTVRSIALSIAQRHCGDTVVTEGNLYQQLKLDGQLIGPLTVEHVVKVAMVFERFLWGEFSDGLAEDAMKSTLEKVEKVVDDNFAENDRPPDDG